MYNRIDFSHNGGFPLEQETLGFMQDSYRQAMAALSVFIGNKVIVSGVIISGGVTSDGFVSVDGELMPFVGGTVGTDVVVEEITLSALFEDLNSHTIYHTKRAKFGTGAGSIPFIDFLRIDSLASIHADINAVNPFVPVNEIAATLEPDFNLGLTFKKQFGLRKIAGLLGHTNAAFTGLKKVCDVPTGYQSISTFPCMMIVTGGVIKPSYLLINTSNELHVWVEGECFLDFNHITY